MTKLTPKGVALVTALALLFVAGPATARDHDILDDYEPGSVLIFPIYLNDIARGFASVVSVTNTNNNRVVDPSTGGRIGDVEVHYNWVDGTGSWQIANNCATLTPNDVRSILSYDVNMPSSDFDQGFLICVAQDPNTSTPVDFDYMIGDIVLVDIAGNKTWNVPGIAIKSLTEERGIANPSRSTRNWAFTDAVLNGGDGNGDLDFDGTEYARWPDILFISSFFRQYSLRPGNTSTIEGELILLTDLGSDFRLTLDTNWYDRDETQTSLSGFTFICWTRVNLMTMTNFVDLSRYDPAGWARLDAPTAVNPVTGEIRDNPNMLGAIVQRVRNSTGLEFGHLLHHTASSNARNATMTLAPCN